MSLSLSCHCHCHCHVIVIVIVTVIVIVIVKTTAFFIDTRFAVYSDLQGIKCQKIRVLELQM